MRALCLLFSFLATGAFVPGCGRRCSGVYSCPADIPFGTLSAVDLPSPLLEISADPPCTATLVRGDGGAASVQILDTRFDETLTCHLHGVLSDGHGVEATVSFQPATLNCCGGFIMSGGRLTLTDRGADGER
jgi:hypothetical protein